MSDYLLEIDYTPFSAACRDPLVVDYGQIVLCRRQTRHEGSHATRCGAGEIVWDEVEE